MFRRIFTEMICVWLATLFVASVLCVEYKDLERMGVACGQRDTCSRATNDFRDTNCECERSCLSFNDCCVDGPKQTRSSQSQRDERLECVPFRPTQGVYGIAKCSRSWNGQGDIKDKCEGRDDLSDPMMSIPLTDAKQALTYRNQYCAICNGARVSDLTVWNLNIICNSMADVLSDYKNITEKFILENIVRVDGSWGLYHWNKKTGQNSFFPCNPRFAVPRSVTNKVRNCRPNIVSSCARNWNRRSVRKDCESYMGVIYINGQGYRNGHCALCNHVSLQNVQCIPSGDVEITGLSWHEVLNIYKKDSMCPEEKVYDTFTKKCRRVICPSDGYTVRNGQCVKG